MTLNITATANEKDVEFMKLNEREGFWVEKTRYVKFVKAELELLKIKTLLGYKESLLIEQDLFIEGLQKQLGQYKKHIIVNKAFQTAIFILSSFLICSIGGIVVYSVLDARRFI
jgi:hypothetical protein